MTVHDWMIQIFVHDEQQINIFNKYFSDIPTYSNINAYSLIFEQNRPETSIACSTKGQK